MNVIDNVMRSPDLRHVIICVLSAALACRIVEVHRFFECHYAWLTVVRLMNSFLYADHRESVQLDAKYWMLVSSIGPKEDRWSNA